MPRGSFSADITAIRERARQKTDDDPARRLSEGILAEEDAHAVVELPGV